MSCNETETEEKIESTTHNEEEHECCHHDHDDHEEHECCCHHEEEEHEHHHHHDEDEEHECHCHHHHEEEHHHHHHHDDDDDDDCEDDGCCCCHHHHHDHDGDDDDEEDEKKERIRNIILLVWGVICLIVAFILEKLDPTYEIAWSNFADSAFFASYSFIALIIYTLGYLPLFFFIGKECIEEIKEGNFFNENMLMLVATIGAYAINEHPEALFVILFSIVGETLEDYATSKSKRSIKKLVNDMPLYAHFLNADGSIAEKKPEDLSIDDIIEIRPGEKIPVDGVVIKGESSLDLSSINGESVPKDVKNEDSVFSGSVNLNSVLQIKVVKEFKDSTLSKIMDLVEHQQSKKAKTEKFITRFAKIYTPIVMGIAILVFLIGFAVSGWSWIDGGRDWFYKALSILLISCPCALVIAVPITFFAGVGSGSKNGILVKGSIALENLAKADTFLFDKTGTLTKGTFVLKNEPEAEALLIAASLESKSTHPLGKVIVEANNSPLYEVESFENIPGYGIKGVINGEEYYMGSKELLLKNGITDIKEEDTPYKTMYLGKKNTPGCHAFIVADQVKEETKDMVSYLKQNKVNNTVILSGDENKIVSAVKDEIKIDQAYGELLPDEKLEKLESFKGEKNKICYVGDGINDSPSILAADVGIAMGALGSDAAIEASDIVIMDDDITKVAEAKNLACKTMNIARLVIFLALALKVMFMVLVMTGILGQWAMVVSGLSDTGVMIVCLLVALTMMLYKPRYLKKK